MTIQKLRKEWKDDLLDVVVSLGVVILAYFAFNYFNPPIQSLLLPIIFLLVLILLKLPDKK